MYVMICLLVANFGYMKYALKSSCHQNVLYSAEKADAFAKTLGHVLHHPQFHQDVSDPTGGA